MSDKKISELPVASAINGANLSVLVSSGTNYQFAFSTLLQFISAGLSVGANVTFGTTLPQNTTGKDGDVFINTSAGSFAQRTSGTWAVAYTLPSSGGSTDGTVLYGLGVPGSSTGNNNDTYINTGTGIFYKKAAGSWGQVFSMATGPAGPPGTNGTNGTNGADGKTILHGTTDPSNLSTGTDGDFYINTIAFTFFGPKAGGVWPAGTNIAGADGATGATGAGVPTGGTTGQVLSKIDGTDYHTQWSTPSGGGGTPGGSDKELQFNDGGAFNGVDNLTFDKNAKVLKVGNPVNPTGATIYFFGDSITAGTGASILANRYTSKVANILGMTENNNGVSSSTLEEQTPSTGAASMVSRIADIPTYAAGNYLCFVYGINDVNLNDTNYNPTNFQADYTTVLNAAVAKGWSGSHIIIGSTTYQNPVDYTMSMLLGAPAPTLARQQAFNAVCLSLATSFGAIYVELFDYIANRGGTDNLWKAGDNAVHPGDNGHALMAYAIVDAIQKNTYIKNTINLVLEDAIGRILGVDTVGNIGLLNQIPAGMKIDTPIFNNGLNQDSVTVPAALPTGMGVRDFMLRMFSSLVGGFDGNPYYWGAFQPIDNNADTNIRNCYGAGRVNFFMVDGNTLKFFVSHDGSLISDINAFNDGLPSSMKSADILIPCQRSVASTPNGNVTGRFVPMGSDNKTRVYNDYSAGGIVLEVSGGTDLGSVDGFGVLPDGTPESLVEGKGIVLRASDNSRWRLTVSTAGVLSVAAA